MIFVVLLLSPVRLAVAVCSWTVCGGGELSIELVIPSSDVQASELQARAAANWPVVLRRDYEGYSLEVYCVPEDLPVLRAFGVLDNLASVVFEYVMEMPLQKMGAYGQAASASLS